MTRIQRIKQKIDENRHELFAIGFVVTLVSLTIALETQVEKQQKDEQDRLNKFIVEQNRAGKTVFKLADGSFIGVAVE